MIAYWLIFLLLLTGGVLSFLENARTRRSAYAIYLCFAVPILVAFAGLRAPGVDADYGLYYDWFSSMIQGTLSQNPFLKDPSFAIIGFSVNSLGLGVAALIAIYSAMCLAAQLAFLREAVTLRWLPLAAFLVLCRFFIPHEMTQIRAAVAIPIMSLGVLRFRANQRVSGSLLLLLAASFHISTLIAVPICMAMALGIDFKSRRWLVAMALLAVLGFMVFSRLSVFLALFARTRDYVTGSYETTTSSLLSIYLQSRLALVASAALFLWKRLGPKERLLIICSGFGVMLEIALASNDALAIRSGEVFGLFDVASALMIIKYLHKRTAVIYVVFLLCLGGVFFRSTTKIVQPYVSLVKF